MLLFSRQKPVYLSVCLCVHSRRRAPPEHQPPPSLLLTRLPSSPSRPIAVFNPPTAGPPFSTSSTCRLGPVPHLSSHAPHPHGTAFIQPPLILLHARCVTIALSLAHPPTRLARALDNVPRCRQHGGRGRGREGRGGGERRVGFCHDHVSRQVRRCAPHDQKSFQKLHTSLRLRIVVPPPPPTHSRNLIRERKQAEPRAAFSPKLSRRPSVCV